MQKILIETKKRSLAKTVSWRFFGSIITGVTVYILTGSIELGATILGLNLIINMIAYFVHERVWSTIKWGYHYGQDEKCQK